MQEEHQMPDRTEAMRSATEYLSTRESAARPRPATSALAVGIGFVFFGASLWVLFGSGLIDDSLLPRLGVLFIVLGTAFILLGRAGSARYRVTESTRYPQQTGELHDMLFQILGENYLWIIVAMMIVGVLAIAWQMGQL